MVETSEDEVRGGTPDSNSGIPPTGEARSPLYLTFARAINNLLRLRLCILQDCDLIRTALRHRREARQQDTRLTRVQVQHSTRRVESTATSL